MDRRATGVRKRLGRPYSRLSGVERFQDPAIESSCRRMLRLLMVAVLQGRGAGSGQASSDGVEQVRDPNMRSSL